MTGIVDNSNNHMKKESEQMETTVAAVEGRSNNSNNSLHGVSSAPMAVLPLNPSAKLNEEPNPFEQSFSGAASDDNVPTYNKLKLPPVASITSPVVPNAQVNNNQPSANMMVIGGGILPKEVTNQFTWDTLRTGPLSPSMLQGPANPDEYYNNNNNNKYAANNVRSSFSSTNTTAQQAGADIHYMQQQPIKQEFIHHRQPSNRQRSISQHTEEDSLSANSNETSGNTTTTRKRSSTRSTAATARRRSSNIFSEEDDEKAGKSKKTRTSSKEPEDEEKRKNFLERNRIAALKCRQRKKQWLNNLQAKVEFLSTDNERLQIQSESLKEEIVNLKTLLLAHKECPVAQQNGFHANAIQQKVLPNALLQQQQLLRNPTANSSSTSASSIQPRYQQQDSKITSGGSSGILRF